MDMVTAEAAIVEDFVERRKSRKDDSPRKISCIEESVKRADEES